MKKLLTALVASSLLVACSDSPQPKKTSLLFAKQGYFHETTKQLEKQCSEKNTCAKIGVEYSITSKQWLNNILNTAVTNSYCDTSDEPITIDGWDLLIGDKAKACLNEFAELSREMWIAPTLDITLDYLGHIQNLEVFNIFTDSYTGGAHGMQSSKFLVIDTNKQKVISFDDVLISGKESKLTELVQQSFSSWLQSNNIDPKQYDWEFNLTRNFTFNEQGMVFVYQPYEITPYAYGMPELVVSYADLKDIIKDEYLNMF